VVSFHYISRKLNLMVVYLGAFLRLLSFTRLASYGDIGVLLDHYGCEWVWNLWNSQLHPRK